MEFEHWELRFGKKNGLGNGIGSPPPSTPPLGPSLFKCSIFHIPQQQTMEDSFSDEVAQSINTHQLKYPIIDWIFHSLKLITTEVMANNMLEYFLSISSFFTS